MTLRPTFANDAKKYPFGWLRLSNELPLQEGVLGASDFKVNAAAAGGMRVDVLAGVAAVKGDTGTSPSGVSQGLFIQTNDGTIANVVTLAGSDGSLPRLDQVILTVRDTATLGDATDDPIIQRVTGTPTSGATLDNRNGAGALPPNSVRLADVLVPAGSSAVVAGNVRDRRPWARGASSFRQGTAAGDYSLSGLGPALVDSATFSQRIECSGVPLDLVADGQMRNNGAAGSIVGLQVFLDGAPLRYRAVSSPAANYSCNVGFTFAFTPTAGSHVLDLAISGTASTTASLVNVTNAVPNLSIRERVAPSASNN